MIIEGRVWKFGRDIDTDVIIPARYLTMFDAKELGGHCLEGVDPDFKEKVSPGDIIMADDNFGCGSSREHAPLAIKGCGVSGVIARSFARIFFRNAINIGLPIFEAPLAVEETEQGQKVRVDSGSGRIENVATSRVYEAQPYPDFIQKIIESGGLINYAKARQREKL
ncbi:MAG: 3-isopropylmalate dehydratase small subunit [Terriglobia bacterium]